MTTPERRYKKVPPFLASPEAAFRWAKRHHDHDAGDDGVAAWMRTCATEYATFAWRAYATGVIEVHRALRLRRKLTGEYGLDVQRLGRSWSRKPEGARVYGMAPAAGDIVVVSGRVRPVDVDWVSGYRGFLDYGPAQWEVALLPYSPVEIDRVVAYDGRKEGRPRPVPAPPVGNTGPTDGTRHPNPSRPVPIMTLEQYALAFGGKTDADVQGHIHAGLRSAPTTKTYRRFYDRRLRELQDERDETRHRYRAAIAAGEIAAPAPETLEEIAARGGERGEAAARVLARRAQRRKARGTGEW